MSDVSRDALRPYFILFYFTNIVSLFLRSLPKVKTPPNNKGVLLLSPSFLGEKGGFQTKRNTVFFEASPTFPKVEHSLPLDPVFDSGPTGPDREGKSQVPSTLRRVPDLPSSLKTETSFKGFYLPGTQ